MRCWSHKHFIKAKRLDWKVMKKLAVSSTGFMISLVWWWRSIWKVVRPLHSMKAVLGDMKWSESLHLSSPPCPFSLRCQFSIRLRLSTSVAYSSGKGGIVDGGFWRLGLQASYPASHPTPSQVQPALSGYQNSEIGLVYDLISRKVFSCFFFFF